MKRIGSLIAAGLFLAVSAVTLVVAVQAKTQAHSTLDQAHRLYEARLQVAQAQKDLGNSDLDTAVDSAGKANATAERVKAITTEIADLLGAADIAAAATSKTSRASVKNVALTRKQTVATSNVLAAIAGYQRVATRFATETNRALVRILRAVRKTNESFPGGP
jgi:hypothetical protein